MYLKDLDLKIELLRAELIYIGMSKGLAAPETVQLSQQLDTLLNAQQQEKASPFKMTDSTKSYLAKILNTNSN